MSARILVVDDNLLNVKLLEARLAHEYYVVAIAMNGTEALEKARTEQPDLILLDIMMPDMDGFEVCRRLKADRETRHIPIIMVTALSDVKDRVRGLEAGADDFLTKPINELALMARARSLLRLKAIMDEWRLRESTTASIITDGLVDDTPMLAAPRILVLDDDPVSRHAVLTLLQQAHLNATTAETGVAALQAAQRGLYDLIIVSLNLAQEDALALCARMRAHEITRTLPILLVAQEGQIDRVARALDLGVNDYILHPLEGSELIARTHTQLQQKHHYDQLRHNYEQSLALALVDPLTGSFNRRYLTLHLPKMYARYMVAPHALSVLMIDIDHFRAVNNTHGHAVGDAVLSEAIHRISQHLRPLDLIVRMGGEEFAVLMPETLYAAALAVAERLRSVVAEQPFVMEDMNISLPVTVSLGVATLDPAQDKDPYELLKRADAALYRAKAEGRNRVVGAETA